MKRLEEFSHKELENIYKNCMNQLAAVRGTPSAECVLYLITAYIDRNVTNAAGYTARCVSDYELKRDIERLMVRKMGYMPDYMLIIFRLFNNLWKTLFNRPGEDGGYDLQREKMMRLYKLPEEQYFQEVANAQEATTFFKTVSAEKTQQSKTGEEKSGTENQQFAGAFK